MNITEFSYQVIAQCIGFIAMIFGWRACTQNSHSGFMRNNMLASLLTAIHLGLMGSMAGMANQLINMGRFTAGQSRRCRTGARPLILATGFSLIALLQGILWAQHWSEWCAVGAGVFSSFAVLYLAQNKLKLAFVLTNLMNLSLSLYLLSWSGMIYQVVAIGLLLKQIHLEGDVEGEINLEGSDAGMEASKA
ncbi:YgjV family protein [Shewanella maritima]|uniref:YgjV family protein n=1 Tax=Shewanella maritima TaxID=2520507 RepID=UPI001F5FDEA6|nr:YgjV family protein [Shewanella maritima]